MLENNIKKQKGPQFSIIIPMKNAERTIAEALESIKGQTFKDYEIFIINDHSEDLSEEKVEEFRINNPSMPISLLQVRDGILIERFLEKL